MNTELLKRTAAYMLQHPENVDMSEWVTGGDFVADKQEGPPCGTTACIAGTAWALVHGVLPRRRWVDNEPVGYPKFRNLLELNHHQATRLFHLSSWPRPFNTAYCTAHDAQARAQVVHDRIVAFIESDGEV